MALTTKNKIFIQEYLKDFNATQAALRAGYSPKTSYSTGSELLKKPELKQAIDAEIATRTMSANEVLTRLTSIARSDYAPYFNSDGSVDLTRLLADGKGYLIKKITPRASGNEIEFYDGLTALTNIAKHHKLLVDKTENDVSIAITDYTVKEAELNSKLDVLSNRLK